jgi:hypothetical protein
MYKFLVIVTRLVQVSGPLLRMPSDFNSEGCVTSVTDEDGLH